ncbi:MAG: C-terminal binding protein [Chloroflexi bacterium]|nr:C-terminal binding protein [Chloroflexota bacterium]
MAGTDRWDPSGWGKPGRVVYCGRMPIDPTTLQALAEGGVEPIVAPLRDENGKVPDAVADADMVVLAGQGANGDVFEALRHVRFVLRPYVGYDDIEVDDANEYGILVANIPDTFVQEVADHAMALILGVSRQLLQMDKLVRSGEWARGARARELARPMHRLSTRTLGLLGFGGIARMVAERAKPFGFTIIAHDPYIPADVAAQMGVTLVGQQELFKTADIVSVHTFLNRETRHLVSRDLLGMMKQGSYLVNTARGPIVDEQALIDALKSGHLAGAGLDVMEIEPLAADSPLNQMENVLLAPHLASYSDEGVHLHQLRVAKIIVDVAKGKIPERRVVINKKLYDELMQRPELQNVERAQEWVPGTTPRG